MMLFLASPYNHPDPIVRQWRFEAACRAVADLSRAGISAVSMVVHSHPLFERGLLEESQLTLLDIDQLNHCDGVAVLMLPGWEQCPDVQYAFEVAKLDKKPIVFFHSISELEIHRARPAA